MNLTKKADYFISKNSAVLRKTASSSGDAVNHLIYGDWLRWLGVSKGNWHKVRCRNNNGWLRTSDFSSERVLEVNFVDIGVGDGTHIVTPDDEVIVIDAGKTDNMSRFLSWRYNLRSRKVVGVDGVTKNTKGAKGPFHIEQAVMSHPDKDHYYGFLDLFKNPKLNFGTIYHNGIVERPILQSDKDALKNDKSKGIFKDLGIATKKGRSWEYLIDYVGTDKALRDILKKFPKTTKNLIATFRAVSENPANSATSFRSLSVKDKFLPGYEKGNELEVEIQGPLIENIEVDGKKHKAFKILGSESKTKNGHSIVFQFRIGNLKIMLGGDLNTASEDYLLRHYTGVQTDASDLEKIVYELEMKEPNLNQDERQELDDAKSTLKAIIAKARKIFQVDVVKAHHHGSHEFSETFLKSINAIATVISSGDDEDYSHPRPDALGAFGKYGRGHRPLIFSTEIARATREFTYIFKYFERLKQYQEDLKIAKTDAARKKITATIEDEKDSNVATYGMITLRTNGKRTIMAQKLEMPRKNDRKWDIQELVYSEDRQEFVHRDKTKLH